MFTHIIAKPNAGKDRKMASKYHPDKLLGVSEDIKKLAQEKFLAVKEAYEQIMKSKKSQ